MKDESSVKHARKRNENGAVWGQATRQTTRSLDIRLKIQDSLHFLACQREAAHLTALIPGNFT